MQKVQRPRNNWRDVVFGCIVLLVVIADQLTKTWIRTNLAYGQSIHDVGFFRILHVQNTGASFGLFKDFAFTLTIVDIVGAVVILVLVFLLRSRWSFYDSMLVRAGMGLVMGGTIGNLIDRLRIGYVTDFLDFKIWPVFNVADASAVVGTIIIAFCLIFLTRTVGKKE
jgi:signal peptidase II